MITKEKTILEPFVVQPWRRFTFREVKMLSKNTSDNYVHKCLKRFVQDNVLSVKRVGNCLTYSLNNSFICLNTVGFLAEYKTSTAKHLPFKNIQTLIDKIRSFFISVIITGSFAIAKQKKTSDLDIVLICDDATDPDSILAQIKLESELMLPEVHPFVFTQEQFYSMLIAREENYGKEIARKNLIVSGGSAYYSIVLEAIKHGFTG